MAPLADRVPDAVACFQYDRHEAALQNMRGGGKPDRTGSDDGDCFCFAHRVLPSN